MPDASPRGLAELSDEQVAAIFAVALPARKVAPNAASGEQSEALVLARRIAQVRFRWFIAYVTADDLEGYQFDAFHEAVIADLQRVFDGEERRLLLSAPPRHGKSRLCAILFPAFFVGARPQEKVIVASYSLELSREHVRECRSVMLSPAFAEVFPAGLLAEDGQASDLLRTTQDGFIRGTGAGGLLTGLGAHLILDDLVKGQEEADSELMRSTLWSWYATSARTRLPPAGFIVGIGTRWRYNDILGRLIGSSADGSGEAWTHRNYPALDAEGRALWPSRFGEAALAAMKVAMGVSQFQALFQGRPTSESGDFFRSEWFRYYRPQDLAPDRELNTVICSDLALTPSGGDYSVIFVVSIGPSSDLFVRTLWRARVSVDDSLNALIALCTKYRPSAWLYENDNIMQSVLPWARQRLRKANLPLWHVSLSRQASKAAKAGALQGLAQERGIYLPDEASWVEAFLSEMLAFPFGSHDDQTDALAHIGRAWPKLRAKSIPRDAALAVEANYDPALPFGGNVQLNALWGQTRRTQYRRI